MEGGGVPPSIGKSAAMWQNGTSGWDEAGRAGCWIWRLSGSLSVQRHWRVTLAARVVEQNSPLKTAIQLQRRFLWRAAGSRFLKCCLMMQFEFCIIWT